MTFPLSLLTEVLGGTSGVYEWMCNPNPGCSVDAILSEAANWTISSKYGEDLGSEVSIEKTKFPVQYYLSQPVEGQYRVQISLVILGVVVACNATKALCMLPTIRRQQSQPLVTLGDAIESFM